MRTLKITTGLLALALVATACEVEGINEQVPDLTDQQSGTYDKLFDVSTDNSGQVRITPTGNGLARSIVEFGDGSGASNSAVVNAGQSVTHTYAEGEYTVTITAIDLAGKETATTYPLSVKLKAPTDLKIGTSGGGLTLTIAPEALLAKGGFQVFFGDVANEVAITVPEGGTATHTYAEAGDYTVTVIALSGGAAVTSATLDVTINNPLGLPIDFETPYTNYNVGGTFGGMGMGVIDNPFTQDLNVSNKVLKLEKPVGAESWAGSWTPLGEPGGIPITIDNGSVFTMLVKSTAAGKTLHFQLEDGSDFKPAVAVPIPASNNWQLLTFDFSGQDIPAGYKFTQFVMQINLSGAGEGEVVYIDEITQTN